MVYRLLLPLITGPRSHSSAQHSPFRASQAQRAEPRHAGQSCGLFFPSTSSRPTSPLTFSLEVAFGLGSRQLEEEGEQQAEPAPSAPHLLCSHGHG